MADLIDRDVLMKEICGNECGSVCDEECENAMCNFYDYIMDVPSANRWIPVEDALPEENKYVFALVKRKHSSRVILSVMIEGKWKIGVNDCSDGFDVVGVITHWMPLPEPPEGGAEDE